MSIRRATSYRRATDDATDSTDRRQAIAALGIVSLNGTV